MKTNNRLKGNIGEEIATKYLEKLGYEILERNWHYSRYGEIDIIAKDKKMIVFVEVKARKTVAFGYPFEAITPKKIEQIKMVANAYMLQNKTKYSACRIDGISVLFSNPPEIEHVKNIF